MTTFGNKPSRYNRLVCISTLDVRVLMQAIGLKLKHYIKPIWQEGIKMLRCEAETMDVIDAMLMEDEELMAHGWQKAEVWLGIELLRNILS